MAQRYPYPRSQERRDFGRSGHPGGSDHDRFRTGGERRYSSDWNDRDRGYEGDRSYAGSGYAEETGYRREGRNERDDSGAQQRGYPYQGSGPGRGRGAQSFDYNRGDDYGREQQDSYSEWVGTRGRDEADDGGGYYGTGHQGGGFGTAAGSRAISRSPYEPTSSGIDFYGRSTDRGADSRWQSQGQRGGRDYGGERGGSGYGGQSDYGSQRYGTESYGGRQQSFRGRGPKGYQRSDERLKELVCETLMEDPDIDAGEVSIEVSGGVVTLTGTAEDRRTKYLIEEAAESVSGVKDINNQLRLRAQSSLSESRSQDQQDQSSSRMASGGAGSGTSSGTQSSGTQSSTSKRN
jgi:osmotically-inducible protein OsmY